MKLASRHRFAEDRIRAIAAGGWGILLSIAAAGCGGAPADIPRRLTLDVRDSADLRIAALSAPPNVAASGGVVADTLTPDLHLGGLEDGFGHIADVAPLPDGRFVVLDRMEHELVLFSSDGRALRRFGREGGGPGEYRDPRAVTGVGTQLVVWDGDPANS